MEFITNPEDPYTGLITQFLVREFPGVITPNSSVLLDVLTDAIVGSKQVRYGPRPNPESLVAIRKVISLSLTSGQPIPFLIPWGSRKPKLGANIDVAEISALKTLVCLNNRVKAHYEPGVQMNVRLEDTSG